MVWKYTLNQGGYGVQRVGGKQQQAHRLAYIQTRGEISEGKQVNHLCNRPYIVGFLTDKTGKPARSGDAVLVVLEDPLEGVGEGDVQEQMPLQPAGVLVVGQQLAGEAPGEQEFLEGPGIVEQAVPLDRLQLLPLLAGLDESPHLEGYERHANPDIDELESQPIHQFRGNVHGGR